jgi:hypothetical protein
VLRKNDLGHGNNPQMMAHSLNEQPEYISDLLLELKQMARSHNLDTLVTILDLAHAEARTRAKDAN